MFRSDRILERVECRRAIFRSHRESPPDCRQMAGDHRPAARRISRRGSVAPCSDLIEYWNVSNAVEQFFDLIENRLLIADKWQVIIARQLDVFRAGNLSRHVQI